MSLSVRDRLRVLRRVGLSDPDGSFRGTYFGCTDGIHSYRIYGTIKGTIGIPDTCSSVAYGVPGTTATWTHRVSGTSSTCAPSTYSVPSSTCIRDTGYSTFGIIAYRTSSRGHFSSPDSATDDICSSLPSSTGSTSSGLCTGTTCSTSSSVSASSDSRSDTPH